MHNCHKCRDTAIGYYNRRWWCVLCSPPILLDRLHEKDMRDKATAKRLRRAS